MALIDSKQLNPRLSGSFTLSGSLDVNKGELSVSEYIKHVDDTNTYLRFTNDRLRVNVGGISYIDLNDAGSAPHDITFNDGGNNVDLTIKGSSNNPLFKTDASTNRIGTNGIGTPLAGLHLGDNLLVDSHVTASANISASGNVRSSRFEIDGATEYIDKALGNLFIVTTGDLAVQPGTGKALKVTGGIEATSHITASGDVYVSGNVSGSSTSTGSFGRVEAAGVVYADSFQSVTGGNTIDFNDDIDVSGHITASGNISGSGTGSFGLVEIGGKDIDPTGVARDQVLKFNGTNFVPAAYNATFEFTISDFDMNHSSNQLISTGSWKAAGALTFTATYNNGPPDGYNGSAEGAPQIRGYVDGSVSSSYDMYPLSSSFSSGTNPMVITYPPDSTDDIRFRLYASAGSDTDNEYTDQRIYFYNQFVYGDLSTNNGFTQANIRTLAAANSVTSNDTSRGITVSVGGSNYLCFAHRTGDTNVAQVQCGSGDNKLTVAMDRTDATTITPLKETVSYLNTAGYTENFYVYASKIANVDAHSTTFNTLTSTTKKNYFYWGYDAQADTYNESFLETSGDWDSYNANSSYDDGTVTGQTLSFGSFTSKYVIIAFPDRYGDNESEFQYKDNSTGLPFDVTKQDDVTITNAVGFQETYHVWRSTNLLTMTNLTVLIDSV